MIKFKVNGVQELKKFFNSFGRGWKIRAMRAWAYYMAGRDGEALRKEPPAKFVTRKHAYGKVSDAPPGYFSWKQFRYVAWKTEGFTKKYERTHEISQGWAYRETKGRATIYNPVPGSEYVMGDKQSRHEKLVGWRTWRKVIADNMIGAIRYTQREIDRLIKELQNKK
ncbi:MAG TPA: hypothetical protein PKC99_12685 [Anaerolineales bacterium]|nr:hypothetical protein [Anaerolineales bacterium]